MSHARASSNPPPIANPLTAAMIGFVIRCCPCDSPPILSPRLPHVEHGGVLPLREERFQVGPAQKAFRLPLRWRRRPSHRR